MDRRPLARLALQRFEEAIKRSPSARMYYQTHAPRRPTWRATKPARARQRRRSSR